jgi:hypothetical protein
MARAAVSGVPDSHSHLDTREGVSASSKRAANVRMKIHRIKNILSSRFLEEKRYV